jgi:GNAT superfamily N-acetyltransferase
MKNFMKIKEYEEQYFVDVFNIVHKTIEEIYPKYYPRSAVDFFHNHHSKENMEKQLPNEFTYVLFENDKLIGTGSLSQKEIKRFFILPQYQGKGYGKSLLEELEKNIEHDKYDKFILDSSLSSVDFYLKNGYSYKNYKTMDLIDGSYLSYLEMDKNVNNSFKINYDNKIFTSIDSTENGEVDKETFFYYHQNSEIVWAEYFGGNIKKGFLLGLVKQNGELEFSYEHINQNNETRTGKCNSIPKILEDGRIELLEKWEWTSGDRSKGESKLVEYIDRKNIV